MFYVLTALPDLQYANYAQYTTSTTVSQYRNPSLSINNHCILTEMVLKEIDHSGTTEAKWQHMHYVNSLSVSQNALKQVCAELLIID